LLRGERAVALHCAWLCEGAAALADDFLGYRSEKDLSSCGVIEAHAAEAVDEPLKDGGGHFSIHRSFVSVRREDFMYFKWLHAFLFLVTYFGTFQWKWGL